VDQFEAHQSNRGWTALETTDPLSICVSQEVLEKLSPSEQRFVLGRAMFGLLQKSAIVHKLHRRDLENLFGSAIRIFAPQSTLLGKPDEEQTRQLTKSLSRKARKALDAAVQGLAKVKTVRLDQALDGLVYSEDRAGLLICGDVSVALNLVLREESAAGSSAPDRANTDQIVHAIRNSPRLEQLLRFSLSNEHFELRQKLTMCV
jgi:cellulose synthase operon protein C